MRKFLWQLYISYLIIMVVSLAAAIFYASYTMDEFFKQNITEELTTRAQLVARLFEGKFSTAAEADVERLCHSIADTIHTRITLLLPTGQVIGDSEKDPLRMENHGDRPEVIGALSGQIGQARRYSSTLDKEMYYLALAVREQGKIAGIVRVSLPMIDLSTTLRQRYLDIALGGLAIAFFAAVISLLVSRRIERPVAEMIAGAAKFATGDFDHRLHIKGSAEIENLAEAMNQMAENLGGHIQSITSQREELEAILSGMVEAVFLIDAKENIIRLNKEARRLFFSEAADPVGSGLVEVLRNPDLLQFVRRTLAAGEPITGDISTHTGGDRFLQGHGVPLRGPGGAVAAALIVLHDITQIRTLENIRKDFVANVSHELRTPITSIKGFVETLQEGALDDPDHARQFLEIIAKQADRLNVIIEDLLSLSRIELEGERKEIALAPGRVKPVLEAAIQTCLNKSVEKRVAVDLVCDDHLYVNANATLLEQAVVNLIDNAIKYSAQGTTVRILGVLENEEIVIRVEDHGCGIAPQHLTRIFERFYRVDKARSRDLGGTGLGLAIVKHIVNAHQGTVAVQSVLGEGSTFSIRLPKSGAKAHS